MIPRKWLKQKTQNSLKKVLKYTLTRKLLHNVSEKLRGPSIVILRCRRVLPQNAFGEHHREAHNPGALFPNQLERLLQEVCKHMPILYLGEAMAMLRAGKVLDRSYAVLTFDEGYRSSLDAALPILEKLNVPATFFLCSAHLEQDQTLMWDEEVHGLLATISPAHLSLPWMDRQLATYPAEEAYQTGLDLLKHLINLSDEKREQRMATLRELAPEGPRPSMIDQHVDLQSLRELADHPLLTFGAHGHTHAPLLSLAPDRLINELHQCRQILRDACGKSYVDVLSFPFGHQKQLAPELLQRAMEVGFLGAMHADEGVARPGDHIYALPRLLLSKKSPILEAYELQGLSSALDETLLVLTGSESARGDYISG
ncbi:MAG: hypothetical protein CMH56_15540 [Myxococcales bacterium]|nr:hypothetical protein [Myxococcales bacterium]|tara:strand:+ start:1780 stop:2889 length:1110 start_codon:yes stop_codon:yes gene_type:complete